MRRASANPDRGIAIGELASDEQLRLAAAIAVRALGRIG